MIEDRLAIRLFGMSRDEAHTQRCCVRCHREVIPEGMSLLDYREYRLTALCPQCFIDITEGPED